MRDLGRHWEQGKSAKRSHRSGVHDCGRCADWKEIGFAFFSGIKDEASMEAQRKVKRGEHEGCLTATAVLARLNEEGF